MSEHAERLNKHAHGIWEKIGTTHAAFADARLVSDLREAAAALSRLEQWKREALAVESEWDAQAVAKLIGLLPGDSIRAAIQPAIAHLQDRASRAEAQRDALMKTLTHAGETFRHYARLHRAKGTADGLAKAGINDELAEQCEAALAFALPKGEPK